ncbi:unnamed protein product [Caenorhabditis bovis]|uniref:Uncharacterized protein n=1 Tax=Caenorhabditis bovis TaxID=2654633 RepID=A0A8S1ECD7_9PELO|nr:unnamed protein product [Caenorhabditis bovis]
MGVLAKEETRKLWETCCRYDEYRVILLPKIRILTKRKTHFKKKLKVVYWNLLVATGNEPCNKPASIQDWPADKIRNKTKADQKTAVLLQDITRLAKENWIRTRSVVGDEQFLRDVKVILDNASKTDADAQYVYRKQLMEFQKFFTNGYEKWKKSAEEICKKAIELDEAREKDATKAEAFNKQMLKVHECYKKGHEYANDMESLQVKHLAVINEILQIFAKSLKAVYWNLMIVTGMEPCSTPSNLKEWTPEKFRIASKSEQKTATLFALLEKFSKEYWWKTRLVVWKFKNSNF